ncbi:MAG: hypothetical protein NT096_06890 [Proteobacteria bacterium]|nr:hypothetical protein [Pseudomonadota bacterium]
MRFKAILSFQVGSCQENRENSETPISQEGWMTKEGIEEIGEVPLSLPKIFSAPAFLPGASQSVNDKEVPFLGVISLYSPTKVL